MVVDPDDEETIALLPILAAAQEPPTPPSPPPARRTRSQVSSVDEEVHSDHENNTLTAPEIDMPSMERDPPHGLEVEQLGLDSGDVAPRSSPTPMIEWPQKANPKSMLAPPEGIFTISSGGHATDPETPSMQLPPMEPTPSSAGGTPEQALDQILDPKNKNPDMEEGTTGVKVQIVRIIGNIQSQNLTWSIGLILWKLS